MATIRIWAVEGEKNDRAARPFLERVCAHPNAEMTADQILEKCRDDPSWTLWLGVQRGKACCAGATQLQAHGLGLRRLMLVAFSGTLEQARAVVPMIERVALANHAALCEIRGRRGWSRVLDGYEPCGRMPNGDWIARKAL